MTIPSEVKLLLLLCVIAVTAQAQNDQPPLLNIGDPAPPLRVHEWLKGKPIQKFKKGRVYVVEFWATWCGYCIEEMPRLSAIARKYKGKVTVIGMNMDERKTASKVKPFVDSMTHWMKYRVAAQDSNFMEVNWFDAAKESGIPSSFVVDKQGRLAWIGYTSEIEDVVHKVVNNSWDMKEAMGERNMILHLGNLGLETFKATVKYNDNRYMGNFYGEPDSALLLINKVVTEEPGLKFEQYMAYATLHALLRKDADTAYEYIRMMMASKDPDYAAIIGSIRDYPYLYNTLPPKIFELGAEACQAQIDHYPYTANIGKNYLNMADWYLLANNKPKAKQAMRKAIKALKSKKRKVTQRRFWLQ